MQGDRGKLWISHSDTKYGKKNHILAYTGVDLRSLIINSQFSIALYIIVKQCNSIVGSKISQSFGDVSRGDFYGCSVLVSTLNTVHMVRLDIIYYPDNMDQIQWEEDSLIQVLLKLLWFLYSSSQPLSKCPRHINYHNSKLTHTLQPYL